MSNILKRRGKEKRKNLRQDWQVICCRPEQCWCHLKSICLTSRIPLTENKHFTKARRPRL